MGTSTDTAPRLPPVAGSAIRMLALDLDGTLLDDTKQIRVRTAAALAELRLLGVKIVLASARPPRSVRHVYAALQLDTWTVNYNGAMIWDEPRRLAVFHRPIKSETARQVIDLARGRYPEVQVSCEIMDRWFPDRLDPNVTTETGRLFTPDVVAPIDEFCTIPITKLLLLGDENRLVEIERLLVERFAGQLTMVRTEGNLIQIMDRRVSKGLAVRQVAEHYGLTMDQVMSIGDAPNDVGMLQLSGIAVAMENGWDVCKQAAHWVAPSNNTDGVLAALRKFGLCE